VGNIHGSDGLLRIWQSALLLGDRLVTSLQPSPEIRSAELVQGGHAVAQFVQALRYKTEDRGFDSR
jgi:hypothetical protein